MSAEEIKELIEFKRKASLFLNLDFVQMIGINSFDEFVRTRVQEAQDATVSKAADNATRLFSDMFNPFEIRVTAQMDNLVRDAAQTKTYLQKINDIRNEMVTIEDNLRNRPTLDDVERRFDRLSNYVSIKPFKDL